LFHRASAGIDAYAGAYGEKLLSARLSFLFLLSPVEHRGTLCSYLNPC
jgi:hypothetical protein